MSFSTALASLQSVDSASCIYNSVASYSAAIIKRIDLTSSASVSFLSFANPEKGDPNSGIFILLFIQSVFLQFAVARSSVSLLPEYLK
jgi:hypothetical protein